MIRKVIDSRFPVMVYNPTGIMCRNYFKVAANSGTLPVFDTEFFSNDEIIGYINELEKDKTLFGIRVDLNNRQLLDYISGKFFKYLNVVVCYYNEVSDLNILKEYQNIRYKVIIETLNIIPLEFLKEIAPEGLIVKGNEAGGRVSHFSTFILMQWYVEHDLFPVFAHGGVGYHTGAGFFAAGASGVVLDSQLYLTDESPISSEYKDFLRKVEEKDTVKCGTTLNICYRFFNKLATRITKDLKERERALLNQEGADEQLYRFIKENIKFMDHSAGNMINNLIYMGQDAVFSNRFVKNSTSLSRVIAEFMNYLSESLNIAEAYDQMKSGSLIATDHGTKYPIMQGPMANISDRAGFARAVNKGGGLPFMAMGSLPGDVADQMLSETADITDAWGVGLIGFSGINKMLDTHIRMVKKYKPGFALFAGGTPVQAKDLEGEGIKTYLHMPSPSMFESGVQNHCKRFIFEGHEAGGHVGSLSSLVLWELVIEKVLGSFPEKAKELSLIFAGGIGSGSGTNFITGMTALLSKAGVKVGIQVGTAYLYTKDIVTHGNIKQKYQELICCAEKTIITGETIGLTTRTVPTFFTKRMIEREYERVQKGLPLQERKDQYEVDNFGALLIGAKGFCPEFGEDGSITLKQFDDDEQASSGNYMCGEALIFNQTPVTIEEIHQKLFHNKKQLNQNLNAVELLTSECDQLNDEIAIIGMGCIYPDAQNTREYWDNIVSKKYSIKQFTDFDFQKFYYNDDRKAEDQSYSDIAGQVDHFVFDYEKFGYTREEADEISPSQQMLLQAAMQAVESSGYYGVDSLKTFPKAKTSVIMASCLSNPYTDELILKQYYPEFKYYLNTLDQFKELSEDEKTKILNNLKATLRNNNNPRTPAGMALNIEASRISAHFGLEGVNYTVDAACATSFTAVDNGVKELLAGDSDISIVGGVNTNLTPETFVGFSKIGALSGDGSYPFDQRAGGFVLGSGAGVLILKRMKDAIRDGDKIFAVLKGSGVSTDGKGKAIAAPQQRGQVLAIERCYENCKDKSFKPDQINYIEAHGTSTLMGDKTEMETIKSFYGGFNTEIGVSSVKSQIGHLLGGSGAAGLIKAVLAIQNKKLPPNGTFQNLSDRCDLAETSIYVIKDAVEWGENLGKPRAAAISSYGFGGINYHVAIEEFTKHYQKLPRKIDFKAIGDVDDSRIVISGVGVIVPGALNSDQFWNVLQSGETQFSKIPEERFHNLAFVDEEKEFYLPEVQAGIIQDFKFNNVRFRTPPSAVHSIDRAQLLALGIADEVIKNAALEPILKDKKNRVGVIIGTSTGEMHNENIIRTRIPFLKHVISTTEGVDATKTTSIAGQFSEQLKARYYKNTEDTVPGLLSNILSGRIANFFNCNGPSYIVEAECASSAIAIEASIRELRSKRSDVVLCGGVDSNLSPSSLMAYNIIKVLSDGDARFFDKKSKGLVMGEGGALLALTTYKYAKDNHLPVIAEMSDIDFQSYPAENILSPTAGGFDRVINQFYQKNAISKNKIDYIDVFASSHKVVDKWEIRALEKNFNREVLFGNAKSQLSYLRAANPAVVLSKLALMTQKDTISPNNSFNPETSQVTDEMSLSSNRDVISLSSEDEHYFAANFAGLGGNIGHAVIKTVPRRLTDEDVVSIDDDFIERVKNIPSPQISDEMVLLFSGQGSQYPGMMKDLYNSIAEIRSIMDQGEAIFKDARGYSLLELMFGNNATQLNLTENTQPAVFLASAAIYSYLKAKGLTSSSMIGQSLGEITALYAADVIGFEDVMKLVLKRSSLMKEAAEEVKGSIMVLFKDAIETEKLIQSSGISSIYLANKNSDSQTAVSGASAGIDQFCEYLKSLKIGHTKLKLSGAFHSPLLNNAASAFRKYLDTVPFNISKIDTVVANLTGKRYPKDEVLAKEMLVRQIVSPVEFVASVKYLSTPEVKHFIEIGPNTVLKKMLSKISGVSGAVVSTDHRKRDSVKMINSVVDLFNIKPQITSQTILMPETESNTQISKTQLNPQAEDSEYRKFLEDNASDIQKLLYDEFNRKKKEEAFAAVKNRGMFTGSIVIPGVSVGLPGKAGKVFNDDNFEKLLKGQNFIERLESGEQYKIVDKNITRVFKDPDGNARFIEINNLDHIIHLAGQLGYFDLKDYGVDYNYDITYGLAIASGIEALKDANIPLVMQYKKMSNGAMIPDGFALPEAYQERTGIIFTSLFPGFETLIREISCYYRDKFSTKPFEEFERIYFYLMENVQDVTIKKSVTDWYMRAKETQVFEKYEFDRSLLTQIIALGSAHFAQMIKAKGPNTMVSGACASATQAIAVAEDWIRMGRCDRVIVVGGEAATSEIQSEWITSGFLALGAATVKKSVDEAVKPFDEDRNGMIVGSGAFGLIVEREDKVFERGFNGQAEVLGTYIGNSAFHVSRIDVTHLSREMDSFFGRIENIYGKSRSEYARSMAFMSHETYTPARGGSADAEVSAIKSAFPEDYQHITVTNVKGYTGHTLGAGIEDVVLVKGLQAGALPAIPNLKKIPPHFADLKFSTGKKGDFKYGFHLAAGFGSHFSFLFIKRKDEQSISNNPGYLAWLRKISGVDTPELFIHNNALCVKTDAKEGRNTLLSKAVIPTRVELPEESVAEVVSDVSVDINQIKTVISEQTGYEISMLDENLDLEADLGIDTVKQVEIFGEISALFNLEVPEDLQLSNLNTIQKLSDYIGSKLGSSQPVAKVVADVSVDINKIKAVISEQTGYEASMLDEDLDLEADLGIDTVKQVEIFGEISTLFDLEVPEDLQLSSLNTIKKLSDYIGSKVSTSSSVTTITSEVSVDINKIKSVISEQTGYEASMLDEDLDLEADLGIDTVKQVEIFGEISTLFDLEVPEDLQLSNLNTIKKLSDYIGSQMVSVTSQAETVTITSTEEQPDDDVEEGGVKRLVMYPVEKAISDTKKYSFGGKRILVTPDSKGYFEKVKSYIEAEGGSVLSIGAGRDIDLDLAKPITDEAYFNQQLDQAGEINGIILLTQVDQYFTEDQFCSDSGLNTSIKSTFMMIKRYFKQLNSDDTIIAAISFNSVVFPYSEECHKITPVFAGISGLFKTVAKELKSTNVKIVDFKTDAPELEIDQSVDLFMKEMESAVKQVEVGYDGGKRYVINIREERAVTENAFIKHGSTLLITGGARGITFEILKEVVAQYQTDLIILGRSDIFSLDPYYFNRDTSEQDIFNRMKVEMTGSKPIEMKRATERVLRFRESAYNIESLKKMGVAVHYHAVDVVNEESVRSVINRYPQINGVLHAAGLDESQLIVKKELSSFNRVFDTKVIGLRNILKAVSKRDLDYLLTFSSVTARLGNEGQVDYTAANDMLGKMVQAEKQNRENLVIKIYDWTAWSGVGMATNKTVKKVLEERGLTFLPVDQGIRFFMDDLSDSVTEEVLISGIDHDFDSDNIFSRSSEQTHFIDHFLDRVIASKSNVMQFSRQLNLRRDFFLNDHAMRNVPIFLGATGIETMIEAVKYTKKSDQVISRLTDFEIPYGIKILKGRPKDLIVEVEKFGESSRTSIKSLVKNPRGEVLGAPKVHYKGAYTLSDRYETSSAVLPKFKEIKDSEQVADLMYHPERLFMGGVFDSVEKVLSCDGRYLITQISDTSEEPFFSGISSPAFEVDVVLLDGMFQTGGIFEFLSTSNMVLPSKIKEMKICGKTEKNRKYFCCTERISEDEKSVTFNVTLFDENQSVIYDIRAFQMVKISRLKEEYRIDNRVDLKW